MNMSPVKAVLSLVAAVALTVGALSTAHALEVNLTPEKGSIKVLHEGKLMTVQRIQDQGHIVDPMWAKTSRKCPPFCIQPRVPVDGVEIAGEYEVLQFMEEMVNTELGILIDARLPSWYKRGTIPGSINIPFTVFDHDPTHKDVIRALKLLGAEPRDVGSMTRGLEKTMASIGLASDEKTTYWDFTRAKELMLWCNGPWCGQSPRAIINLVNLGYPKEKIHYYRGGMQNWHLLGLTTIIPEATPMFEGGAE